jgi:hypothetical protein
MNCSLTAKHCAVRPFIDDSTVYQIVAATVGCLHLMRVTFRGPTIDWLRVAAITFGFLLVSTGGCECPARCTPRVIASGE